ncbi:RrF2 family transcriptional regulator [Sphingobium boeckii]|uniref:Rrf2 family nitric oxide-sensitive transcriptional repressor n=1 Tax=Sphingobium boeckii TaxID=1082345 RepID=A0A7W9AK83_9SPHN|nr:Rrf2 family transcriptional regulator [Sphingobium boeckii]MBB5687016.1 Rrf2 family nitric oxide-sensitive transcriptional repressor [Sphingobium boeckii]
MRLTLHTDYALRVLIYLAAHEGQRCSIPAIAQGYDISRNHLMKVVHVLGRGGFIKTVRGRGGGFQLARPASEINIGAVVRHTETDLRIADCGACVIGGSCGLTGVLGQAVAGFLQVLDGFSLADIARDTKGFSELMFPRTRPDVGAPA